MRINPAKNILQSFALLTGLLFCKQVLAIMPIPIIAFADIPTAMRPALPSLFLKERTESVEDFLNTQVSLTPNTFVDKTFEPTQAHAAVSAALALFGAKAKIPQPMESIGALSNFLSQGTIPISIDKDNPKKFTFNWPGIWLSMASQLSKPIPTINWGNADVAERAKIKASTDYIKYFEARVGSQIQSQLAFSNLFHLMAERMPQTALANKGQMEAQDQQANFRMQDGAWRANMRSPTITSTEIARQTLFVLAEIRQELHQARKDNQRLLASISLMQAQLASNNHTTMEQMASRISEKATADNDK